MKKKKELLLDKKNLQSDIRGDSIDDLANMEAANVMLSEKEIGQQRENL
ncbi:MAG: hypothetical protein ABF649_14850 [Bacillus sp. (in: firmicutes)]